MLSKLSKDLQVNISDENRLRLGLLTRKLGLKYVKQIIFTYFPKDPILLYNALVACQSNLRNLFQDQHQILFGTPSLGTDIDKCDLTLLGRIVKLKNDPNSNTIRDLLEIRNWIAHYGSKPLADPIYTQKFNEIKVILIRLGANDGEVEYFRHARIENSIIIIEDLLKDIRSEIPHSEVLREALDIVCKHIDKGWRDLAISLDIHLHIVENIAQQMITNEEKMNKCFEYKSFNISWNFLKQQLIKQKHSKIMKKIVKETYITTELEKCSNDQRDYYQSTLGKVQRTDPLSNMPLPFAIREEEYVSLYLSNDIGKTEAFLNSDHLFNLTNQFGSRQKIDLKDIFNDHDDFVLIRGIGGVGKSTLADMLVLKWSKGELLKDIKLLFYIKCREIEEIDQNTLKEFLSSHFLSEGLSINDITEIGKQILFVFDGLDELESSKLSIIYRMLKDNFKLQSTNFRVCVTGRPNAIDSLMRNVETPKTLIDVMGFTPDKQRSFIEHYYKERQHRETLVSKMIENIELTPELESLATIPLYLRILCYVNDHDNGFDHVTSTVSLNLVVCLYIVQKCYKELCLSNADLHSVARDKRVVQTLLKLGKLSVYSLKNQQVIFRETDFGEDISDLENSGFLIKYGTKKGFKYQFQHLIFSEFLCGLYLFSKGRSEICDVLLKPTLEAPLWNCLPTLIALHTSASQLNSNHDLVSLFLEEILSETRFKLLLDHQIDCLLVKLFHSQLFNDESSNYLNLYYFLSRNNVWNLLSSFLTPKIISKLSQKNFLFIDDSCLNLLVSISVSKRNIPAMIADTITKTIYLYFNIFSSQMLYYVTRVFSSHLEHVSDEEVTTDLLIDFEGVLTDAELERMKPFLVRCEDISITLKFNARLFLSLLTEKKENERKSFIKLKVLGVSSLSEELIEYIPYLESFLLMNCDNVPVESAGFLSRCFQESKAKKEIVLKQLVFKACHEEVIKAFLVIIPYITELCVFHCILSIPTLEVLSKTIKESNLKEILMSSCNINNDGVQPLSSCFSYITRLRLPDNPDISEIGIQTIVDSILQQVEENGKPTLVDLDLSHLNKNLLKVLMPAVPYLSWLRLRKSEIDEQDMKQMRDKAKTRKEILIIRFDNDITVDKKVIQQIFSGVPVDIDYF